LLVERLGRRVHQAEDLIHRLASGRVAMRKPALAIERTPVLVASPVRAFSWIVSHFCGHGRIASRSAVLGCCAHAARSGANREAGRLGPA
jgi:hypothetical protein